MRKMQTKSERIEREFEKLATVRGGLLLFEPSDAVCLVKHCKAEGVSILGIDGFLLNEKTTQPLSDQSIDFSSGYKSDNDIYQKAIDFLEERRGTLFYFEITLD